MCFSTKRIHSAASVRAKSLYTEVRAKQSNRAEKDTMENGYKNLEGSCMLRRVSHNNAPIFRVLLNVGFSTTPCAQQSEVA